ncbi:MAG: TIGR03619 family F420-dependent LLM class oxidoreductase [Chloroflexota bacterium]|nr:TIGR03619 family F420-dependent LLM class oxidoreductase [Chloroflexota bacterium]
MQFGAHLPTYWEHYGTSDVQTAVAEAATAADALGYASVWANDLVVVPAAKLTGANVIEPLITLASLVHLVARIKLGTSVLVLPQRNALLVAKQAATLDLLSGGRLLLGVGIGHREAEFAQLGADFAHRAAVTDEAIEVLRTLWRDPVASYQGRFHRLDAVRMLPQPARGGPPIWVGGSSPGALRRAVRHGDAWLPFMIGLDDFRSRVADLHGLSLMHGGRCPTIAKEFNIRLTRTGEPADVLTTYPQQRPGVAGSPDAVAQYLEAFQQAGMEYALCAFASEGVDDLLRQLRVFAEEVAPRFAGAGAPDERLHA